MKATETNDPRIRAIAAALSLNRGEIDPAKLAQLLRIIEGDAKPTPA
jgi:hypothetical protein